MQISTIKKSAESWCDEKINSFYIFMKFISSYLLFSVSSIEKITFIFRNDEHMLRVLQMMVVNDHLVHQSVDHSYRRDELRYFCFDFAKLVAHRRGKCLFRLYCGCLLRPIEMVVYCLVSDWNRASSVVHSWQDKPMPRQSKRSRISFCFDLCF